MTDTDTTETRPVPLLPVETLPQRLRNAAAWFKIAAERLEDGDREQSANMVYLGACLAEGIERAIRATVTAETA